MDPSAKAIKQPQAQPTTIQTPLKKALLWLPVPKMELATTITRLATQVLRTRQQRTRILCLIGFPMINTEHLAASYPTISVAHKLLLVANK